MDLRELLGMLDMPPGESYYRSRIPCPEDERVARVVRAFSESSPGRQAVFREAIDGVRAGLLLVFSERMAASRSAATTQGSPAGWVASRCTPMRSGRAPSAASIRAARAWASTRFPVGRSR